MVVWALLLYTIISTPDAGRGPKNEYDPLGWELQVAASHSEGAENQT